MNTKYRVQVARVYDDPRDDDGERILVDRVWPRGFRKDDKRVGRWVKDVAPSKELREWYNHDPARFDKFASRYNDELKDSDAYKELHKLANKHRITLVTATRDVDGSQAAVLAELLSKH